MNEVDMLKVLQCFNCKSYVFAGNFFGISVIHQILRKFCKKFSEFKPL